MLEQGEGQLSRPFLGEGALATAPPYPTFLRTQGPPLPK
jgi:hypothetical protein